MSRREPTKNPVQNIQVIDLVRTLAILPVLAAHLAPTLPPASPPFQWLWDHFQCNGRYGVCLFFVVSGFLITRILDSQKAGVFRPRLKNFYVRRVGRILPLFLLSIALGLAMVWISREDPRRFAYCFKLPSDPAAPAFWLPLFFFLFNWAEFFLMAAWQGLGYHWALFWSLAVEEQFYFFYPWILKGLGRQRNLLMFLSATILAGVGWRWMVFKAPWAPNTDFTFGSFGYFDQIAIGILLYFGQKRWKVFLSRNQGLCVGLAVAGGAGFGWVYLGTSFNDGHDWVYAPTLLAAGLAVFLLGALHLPFFESEWLRAAAWPGKYSYGNYLFHIIVLYFLNAFIISLNVFAAFLVFAAVSTMIAALSFHCFERPANRWIGNLFHPQA
jgi:peptidoglycan/LPS O-acetylase OafA/YrhL